MLPVFHRILLLLMYFGLGLSLLSTIIGLPGNWILVVAAFIIGLVTDFSRMTVSYVILCLGLAVLGELVESLVGVIIVARRGGTKLGVIGSIVGGLLGVVLGGGLFPPFGSVALGFVGAFAGAVVGEMLRHPDVGTAVRVGFWSFVGRVTAMAAKMTAGCAVFWIIVRTTWP